MKRIKKEGRRNNGRWRGGEKEEKKTENEELMKKKWKIKRMERNEDTKMRRMTN